MFMIQKNDSVKKYRSVKWNSSRMYGIENVSNA